MTIADIVARIYKNTKTNSISYDAATMLIDINVAYNRVVSLVNRADSRWQWDDTNNTDLSIAATTVTSGQKDYSMTTAFLTIDRVDIQDSAGNWTELNPIDQHDIKGQSLQNYLPTTGVPTEYDKVGNSIFLYPTPNYTKTGSISPLAGLVVYYTRGPAEFTSGEVTTGTKQPGFNSLFHDLVPLWVSHDYWLVNDPSMTVGFLSEIQRKEQEIIDSNGGRSRDERPRLTVSTNGRSSGNTSGRISYQGSDSNK